MSDYLNKRLIINLFTVIIIFSLDRISKFYVLLQSEKNLSYDLFESKFLNINLEVLPISKINLEVLPISKK